MATTSVPKAEPSRIALAHALKEALERFNHELMDDEERQLLLDRIKPLRQGRAYRDDRAGVSSKGSPGPLVEEDE